MKKRLLALVVLSVSCAVCFSQGAKEVGATEQVSVQKQEYVASTSWVASIAQLAGIDDVVLIAPANLRHPPEYEITPDDIVTIANAKLFMQAGYEVMMKTISVAAEVDQSKVLKVKTTNTLANLSNMVNMLSQVAGTEKKAEERFGMFSQLIEDARGRIAASPNKDTEVFANKNQAEFARDLGLNVVSTFGDSQLTSDDIAEAAEKKYLIVIDNFHNPIASPIGEVCPESNILTFRNFPDYVGENALYDVVSCNLEMLWSTGLF